MKEQAIPWSTGYLQVILKSICMQTQPPFKSPHSIKEMVMLNMWWEDADSLHESHAEKARARDSKDDKILFKLTKETRGVC